jgi:hypothetical protein
MKVDKKEAVLSFMRAPKPGSTITIGAATMTVKSGMRRPKLDPAIYGQVFVLPTRELAVESVRDMVHIINSNPVVFGVHAVAQGWHLRLEPIVVENRVEKGVTVSALKVRKADIKRAVRREKAHV